MCSIEAKLRLTPEVSTEMYVRSSNASGQVEAYFSMNAGNLFGARRQEAGDCLFITETGALLGKPISGLCNNAFREALRCLDWLLDFSMVGKHQNSEEGYKVLITRLTTAECQSRQMSTATDSQESERLVSSFHHP